MNLPSELVALAWSQIWQVTALAVVVGLATRLLFRRRPHLAYVLWMLVVLKCLTPPLWSSPTGLFSWAQFRIELADDAGRAVPVLDSRELASSAPAQPEETDYVIETAAAAAPVGPAPLPSAPPVAAEPPAASWWDHVSFTRIAAVSWIAGSLALAGLLWWKWSAYRRALRRSAIPCDAAIERLAALLAERLGLRRKVRVMVTSESIGPAAFGLLRPVVVLPQAVVDGKTPQRIEPILAHELVHVRRGDIVWGAMQLLAEILWWFHPLVWWANRETCRERERCCDEEVVAGLKFRPAAYARCLLDVLESEQKWQPVLAVPGVRFMGVTSNRLEDIMSRSSSFHSKTPRWSWAVLIVAAALVLPGGAMVLARNEPLLEPKGSAGVAVAAINHAAQCLALSPDSRTLAGGMRDGSLTFWDAATGNETKTVATGESWVRAILFLPEGNNVLTAGRSVKQWNATTGECVKSVDLEGGEVFTAPKAFSRDGKFVAGSTRRKLLLWDAMTGRKKHEYPLMGYGLAAAFSPDNRLVAVGTTVPMGNKECKSGVQIWDVQTGQLKRTILEPTGSVSGLAFSHHGKLLAGGTHREAIVWDADTGAVRKRLPGFHGPVESIAFSHDDRLLAAGGQGPEQRTPNQLTIVSELNVWNLASSKKVLSRLGSCLRVTSVVFSQDGKRIAACDDREIVVRNLDEEEPIWTKHYEIEVMSEEFQIADTSNALTAASSDAAEQTTVTGQVVDSAGKAIAGAKVAVVGRSRNSSSESLLTDELKLLGTTKADSEGRFTLNVPKLASAAYYSAHAVAVADGCNIGWQSLGLDVAQPQVTIAPGKEQTVHGRVVDAKGEPAANAAVHVTSFGRPLPGDFDGLQCWLPPSQLPFWPKPATTDGEGRFTLRGVDRSGILHVQVRDDRFAIDWLHLGKASGKDARVTASPSGELTLSPPPARFFAGTITGDDTHKPIAGARVEIGASVDPMTCCIMNMAGRTDAEGRFQLKPYSGKVFYLTVYPPRGEPYLIYQKEIELADGQQPPKLDIALPRGVLLRGKITEKSTGAPVAGAAIKYEEHSRPPYRPERILPDHAAPDVHSVTRADGTYQIAVPPGRGTLFVQGPHNDYIRQTINTWDFNNDRKRTISYRRYVGAFAPMDLKPGEASAERNAAIRRGVTVSGRIVGPSDKPVGDVLIISRHFIGAGDDMFNGGNIRVKDGQFSLHGLDPDVSVPFHFLDPKNETGATVEIAGKSDDNGPLVVRLQPCGKAVARFVDAKGQPKAKHDPGLSILVSPGPFCGDGKRNRKEVSSDQDFVANFDREHYWKGPVTDAEGRCTLPSLIPGATYRLPIFNKLGDWDEKDFTVKSGETLQLPAIIVEGE